ncbi:hypothetical protein AAEX28_02745 [Lentisphaerota bacterium WC36G]|nr:hypothetical protein LJT99_05625 [Lentisphaerae bacterium WC36]
MRNHKKIVKVIGAVALLAYATVLWSVDVKTIHGREYKNISVIDYNAYNFDFSYEDSNGKIAIGNLSYAMLDEKSLKALKVESRMCPDLEKKEQYYRSMSFESLVKENEKLLIEDLKGDGKVVLSKHLKCQVYSHRRQVKLKKHENMLGGTIYQIIAEKKFIPLVDVKDNEDYSDPDDIDDKNATKLEELADKDAATSKSPEEKIKEGTPGSYVYIPSAVSIGPELGLEKHFTTIYPTGMNFHTKKYGEIAIFELSLHQAVHILHAHLISRLVMLNAVNRYKNKAHIKHDVSDALTKADKDKEVGENFYPQVEKIKILEIEPYVPFFDFSKDNPIPEELR